MVALSTFKLFCNYFFFVATYIFTVGWRQRILLILLLTWDIISYSHSFIYVISELWLVSELFKQTTSYASLTGPVLAASVSHYASNNRLWSYVYHKDHRNYILFVFSTVLNRCLLIVQSTRQNNIWFYTNEPVQKFTYASFLILCHIFCFNPL